MKLTGIHALLTYRCTFACDHCFVFGSPWQDGTMTLKDIRNMLQQAKDLGTVEWIFFEGGEPFLYYATLLKGVQEAVEMGLRLVSSLMRIGRSVPPTRWSGWLRSPGCWKISR